MKIVDVDFYLLDPTGDPAHAAERSLLVRLWTTTKMEGWGEARVSWRPAELAPRREWLLPLVAGRSVAAIEELLQLEPTMPSGLRAALEMASWDLLAREAQRPLSRIWGGEYRPRVPLAMRLPIASPGRTQQLARDLAERGFHCLVIPATGQLPRDLETVAAVAQVTTDHVELRLDANGRYPADDARELCRQLERTALQFIVDPLDSGIDGLAALTRQTTVPLAVCAPLRSAADLLMLLRAGGCAHLIIDVNQVGGLWPARQCAVLAAAAQLPASLRGAAGLGVALAGVLQLAAAAPNLGLAHECAWYQLRENVLRDQLSVADGTLAAPQGVGLGIEVDRLRLESYLVA